jgi:hypothetical protein
MNLLLSKFVGKLMLMAVNGHFLTQIPHPMHNVSEVKAILGEAARKNT